MELDPGIHIVMHSVLSLKPVVTTAYLADAVFITMYSCSSMHHVDRP